MPRQPSNRPIVPRNRILVAVTCDVDYELRCARDYGVGAEVQTFSWPHMLEGDYMAAVRRLARRVARLKGPIGCHGPFLDTTHYSQDPEIRNVARMRYLQALEIAETLGARYMVLHSQYNPIIKVKGYADIYHNASLAFWPEIIDEANRRGVTLCLENMFDDSPEPLRRLLEDIGPAGVRLCLDVAHAHVFSERDLSEWVKAFGPYLAHVHLNDCNGQYDDHLGVGQGELEWSQVFGLLKSVKQPLTYALETGKHTAATFRFLGLKRV
jgi:sugar phosphate isomerase/epimerase